jgi:hypothetical protein
MAEVSTTELLVVKAGDTYIRFIDTGFEYCSMNKASVFPLGNIGEVRKRCDDISSEIQGLQLMKLVITEEPFTE